MIWQSDDKTEIQKHLNNCFHLQRSNRFVSQNNLKEIALSYKVFFSCVIVVVLS